MYQQVNLILLVATLAAGPFLTSWFGSRAFLQAIVRGPPGAAYVFSGDPLAVDYTLENGRRWTAALALFMEDSLVPTDRAAAGSALSPRVFFPRVPGNGRARMRWQGHSPRRGKLSVSRPGLWERGPRSASSSGGSRSRWPTRSWSIPRIGQLTRRWFQLQRQASENRMGKRHDRSSQQEEYHGLRDYRPGDSPRWIHWRTSARRGELMVKEFEQQNEQELAILIDPWLPRTKVASELRDSHGAGHLVRGDGLPGDLPAAGPAADAGLDRARRRESARARPRSSCCTSCSSSLPCSARRPRGRLPS